MPAPTPQKRRNWTTVALIVVPVVVIAAMFGGVALFWGDRSSDADGRPVDGQLRATFPTQPAPGWSLRASDVFDGAVFVRPDPISNSYGKPGFIDLDDTLITSAVLPNSDRGIDLVAIDSKTGAIRWRTTIESGTPSLSGLDVSNAACASAAVDGMLPCVVGESVAFYDVSDGSVRHRLAAPHGTQTVEVHGSDVYSLGYQTMARGTANNLVSVWQNTLTTGPDGCSGSGDSQYLGVTDDYVYFGTDGGVVVADTADGRRLIDGEPQYLQKYGDNGFTGLLCTDGLPTHTVVADANGAVLRIVDGVATGGPVVVSPGVDVPYLIENTAFDFTTGQRRWAAETGVRLSAVIGDVVLGVVPADFEGAAGGPLAAYDAATGERLWVNDSVPGSAVGMTDGDRVLMADPGGVTGINLSTGQRDWSLAGVDIHDLAQAGDGFAASEKELITFYPPTGGSSIAPGRAQVSEAEGDGGLITKCGRVPEMRPIEYRAENGVLVVKMEVKATCPGGDVVRTNRMRITVRDDRGIICSGVFDFSSNPLILEGDGSQPTTTELIFDSGSILRHPNTLGDRSGSDPGATSAKAKGTEVVDCEDEGATSGPAGGAGPPNSTDRKFASLPDAIGDCGSDAEALEALRVQVDADRPVVQTDLADRWVAQLSSKQPGLVAPDVDGIRVVTWTPCEILRQHLRLRLKYPEVRLVWSDEWRTFDLQGWWVTIAGLTFADSGAANRWCDDRAIPVDECYAKVISNNHDSSGSTRYRR